MWVESQHAFAAWAAGRTGAAAAAGGVAAPAAAPAPSSRDDWVHYTPPPLAPLRKERIMSAKPPTARSLARVESVPAFHAAGNHFGLLNQSASTGLLARSAASETAASWAAGGAEAAAAGAAVGPDR